MFNGSNTAATVNWIDSADFIRNETGRSTLAEDWNDIILADSAGTVLVEPGIVGSLSPFSGTWASQMGTIGRTESPLVLNNFGGNNVSYVDPYALSENVGGFQELGDVCIINRWFILLC